MSDSIYTSSFYRKYVISFVVVLFLVVVSALLYYQTETGYRIKMEKIHEWERCRIGTSSIDEKLVKVRQDLEFTKWQFVEHDSETYLDEGMVHESWIKLSSINRVYDQIRWIDEQGMELARVDFHSSTPVVIPESGLQNKSDRYYFKHAIGLEPDDIYVSQLDLNEEHGQVEMPRKPIIRFATPVLGRKGDRKGIVMFNYLADHFLEELNLDENESRPVWLLNTAGYWLKGPTKSLEWGFMFNRPDLSMSNRYPDAWAEISGSDEGQFIAKEGMWTFKVIRPMELLWGRYSPAKKKNVLTDRDFTDLGSYEWKAVSFIPTEILHANFGSLALKLVLNAIGILVFSAGCIFLLARAEGQETAYRVSLKKKVDELDERNEELKAARMVAENASRMKADFLANMSHEIRTPLNAVIGMTDILMQCELDDESRDCAQIIHSSGELLVQLINDILDFSKIESGKIEIESRDFNMEACVEGALDLLCILAADKQIELTCDVRESVPAFVKGDSAHLQQILLNLLSNALKFTEKGQVDVLVEGKAIDNGHELLFSVKDTGIGIKALKIDHIFHAFIQADASTTREFGGTGLGLTISRNLAELMGGRMWVESTYGEGSTFYFTIRVERAEPDKKHRPKLITQSAEAHKIIVVDDNATNRRIICAQLTRWGLSPVAFEFPDGALESIVNGDQYTFMVCDMQMPKMDGSMLISEIRKHRTAEELPILILSSMGAELDGPIREEVEALLIKPVKSEKFYDTISTLLSSGTFLPSSTTVRMETPDIASLRILVVEDNRMNQMVMERLLKKLGYAADFANDGVEALEKTENVLYDLIFMDIQMPRMDGYSATEALVIRYGEDRDKPQIVGMSAHAMDEHRTRGLDAGMNDYITKPINFEILRRVFFDILPSTRR